MLLVVLIIVIVSLDSVLGPDEKGEGHEGHPEAFPGERHEVHGSLLE
jgi:hypothetical protein